jgi:hypothetical protein
VSDDVTDASDVMAVRFSTALTCHPSSGPGPVEGIGVSGSLTKHGELAVRYELAGDMRQILIPSVSARPVARDELWQHTCCEMFLADGSHAAVADTDAAAVTTTGVADGGRLLPYREFNFSPSGDWAAYEFDAYRRGGRPVETPARVVMRYVDGESLVLSVRTRVPRVNLRRAAALSFNAAVVVETIDGTLQYWAVKHPQAEPDFHDRLGFVSIVDC